MAYSLPLSWQTEPAGREQLRKTRRGSGGERLASAVDDEESDDAFWAQFDMEFEKLLDDGEEHSTTEMSEQRLEGSRSNACVVQGLVPVQDLDDESKRVYYLDRESYWKLLAASQPHDVEALDESGNVVEFRPWVSEFGAARVGRLHDVEERKE